VFDLDWTAFDREHAKRDRVFAVCGHGWLASGLKPATEAGKIGVEN